MHQASDDGTLRNVIRLPAPDHDDDSQMRDVHRRAFCSILEGEMTLAAIQAAEQVRQKVNRQSGLGFDVGDVEIEAPRIKTLTLQARNTPDVPASDAVARSRRPGVVLQAADQAILDLIAEELPGTPLGAADIRRRLQTQGREQSQAALHTRLSRLVSKGYLTRPWWGHYLIASGEGQQAGNDGSERPTAAERSTPAPLSADDS